jgi:hypothetical protein
LLAVLTWLVHRRKQAFRAGAIIFLLFSFNMARAEIEEVKLILDEEAAGWRERNADWTSTWDWNRILKRKERRQRSQL